METLQKVRKAWGVVQKKDRELRGSSNGSSRVDHKWLRDRTQGVDWLANLKTVRDDEVKAAEESDEVQALEAEPERAWVGEEKFKLAATHVRKECAGLREENAITARALEQETKRARKEE